MGVDGRRITITKQATKDQQFWSFNLNLNFLYNKYLFMGDTY